jgi:hypothetical protein
MITKSNCILWPGDSQHGTYDCTKKRTNLPQSDQEAMVCTRERAAHNIAQETATWINEIYKLQDQK